MVPELFNCSLRNVLILTEAKYQVPLSNVLFNLHMIVSGQASSAFIRYFCNSHDYVLLLNAFLYFHRNTTNAKYQVLLLNAFLHVTRQYD